MMPPTRIEQLNNFQDAVQSPDGLDRLRALQVIEQALPSSQGLMGMPQVQAPMPVVNRKSSGVATPNPNVSQEQALENLENLKGPFGLDMGSGIAEVFREKLLVPEEQKETGKFFDSAYKIRPGTSNDLIKIFARDQEGILNRALQGGVLEGQRYTPIGGSPTTAVLPESTQTQNTLMGDGPPDQALGQLVNQFTFEGNQPQVVKQLGRPNRQGFKSKESAMAHARENQGGGMVNVYQLPDGSWDYQRTGRSPNAFMGGGLAMAGGGMLKENMSIQPMNLEEQAMMMQQVEQQQPREINPQIQNTAQGLASLGRGGDNMLLHINPAELQGLASMLNITINPTTGMPEVFLNRIVKAVRKLAPVALAIAAPYAFGATTALGIGAATAGGSFLGNIIAGAKPKDALKAGLFSGLTAGFGSYLGGAASGLGSGGTNVGTVGTQGFTGTGYGGINQGVTPNIAGASSAGTNLTRASIANTGYGGINKIQGPPIASEFTPPSSTTSPTTTGLSNRAIDVPKQSFQLAQTQPIQPTFNPDIPTNMTIRGDSLNQYVQSQQNIPVAKVDPQQSTSIFDKGGLSSANLKRMGQDIYRDYANPTGILKAVGMDLTTPDWEAQYAAEAAAKQQQLKDAGYTVDTGFGGQTVIRDSSGVQMPRTLTVQQILDRALGKTPRTKLVADYRYGPSGAKEGGLVSLKHGGEFSGMVPGEGHGMEDNVYMPIVEKGHGSQVGTLAVSPSEYVVDSYTMAALGNGNADAGAKVMDRVVKSVRKKAYGDTEQPNEISGLQALKPMMERV